MASCLLPPPPAASCLPRRFARPTVPTLHRSHHHIPLASPSPRTIFSKFFSSSSDSSPQPQPRTPSLSTSIFVAPLAAFLAFSLFSSPAEAGILSGSAGLRSFDLPSIPKPESLKKIQEENKMRYEGLDEKFKSSPFVQELLKRSKQNAELRKKEIQDKYCLRGADWGVGDCSTAAMSEEERASFIENLKKEVPQ